MKEGRMAKGGVVLLVDDEVKILSSLSRILENYDYEVLTALDGKSALSIIEENDIDVVLLDLKLPEMDGIRVLKKIMEKKPSLPVIMLTAHGSIPKAVEAVKIGAFDFLEKPVESEKILITIKNALEKSRLEKERTFLIQEALEKYKMVGISNAMKKIFSLIEKIAPTDAKVLITGESGVGKELIARAIHFRSSRAGGPFVVLNCAAIPEELIESELFGHEKGAFTGAIERKEGKFKLASGGTLFLDEIGDMSLRVQAKVLRAIEEGEIQRVGGKEIIEVNTRIICASNKDLERAVRERKFREDLYYRIKVIHIHVPPLRERKEDIPALLRYYLQVLSKESGKEMPKLHPSALEVLFEYPWPGNVRELRNLVEKVVVLYPGKIISRDDIMKLLEMQGIGEVSKVFSGTLSDARKKAEREAILAKLLANNWDYELTAKELGISRATLFNKLKEYGIRKSKKLDF
ncbi:sigma-54 dependent transcriptional regulator [Candidatus Aminicenantes bacterium AC-335-B20]|jgi:two-component system nitrogen regulation response regulator NtrX|nr:sigma-54 dependent transcriptional regulator [SCandidatus Aminicenantes bacterium Aminicenantia_JdfR_composite]MCP2599270.1 sigma-54 dependent transcriptional regulator [Candidatus Aminicenantes bacterium AC-335-B20]MCP2605777.1 sigma-54 dependent transcriptional regulator [Candidatus Aminicenantes bacterium AC-335-O07]MCP2619090.1 sigma-54 dependent transcriptional regulator [Candidatus Aminicenantes bacterium AC-335-A11]MCP2620845.1 sigma-54 dependent transcriptional regulator [Candidatus 